MLLLNKCWYSGPLFYRGKRKREFPVKGLVLGRSPTLQEPCGHIDGRTVTRAVPNSEVVTVNIVRVSTVREYTVTLHGTAQRMMRRYVVDDAIHVLVSIPRTVDVLDRVEVNGAEIARHVLDGEAAVETVHLVGGIYGEDGGSVVVENVLCIGYVAGVGVC